MKAVITGNLLACLICLSWALPVVSGLSTNWLLIAYLGFFQIALAYLLVTAGMRRVTATEAALLILVEPVLNPIWVWWFQHERPGPRELLGGAVILGACLLRIWQRWGVGP